MTMALFLAPSAAEILRLKALAAGPDYRLACQSYTRGEVEIQVVHPGTEAPSA